MLVNVDQVLIGYDGEELSDLKGALTLRRVCAVALTSQDRDDKVDSEDKMKRFLLAQRIYKNDPVMLNVEELALVKKLVGEGFGAVVVGPAWLLLDPPEDEKAVPISKD